MGFVFEDGVIILALDCLVPACLPVWIFFCNLAMGYFFVIWPTIVVIVARNNGNLAIFGAGG